MEDKVLELAKQIAPTCHEVNKAYCELIGDNSQAHFKDAADWQKESAIKGVIHRLQNPEITPEQQHEAWMKDKLADGWVYGEVKDAEAKTHPCLVPYNELPENQRTKDKLFQAVVDALAPKYFCKTNRSFGVALQALQDGKRVAREGWNGKGLFVFMQVPATINQDVIPKMQSLPDSVKSEFAQRGGSISYSNQLALVSPNNIINGWAPSVSDSLAKDWVILD